MQIVGLDCAAQPKNVGFAYAQDQVLMTWGAGWDPVPDIAEAVDWDQPVLIGTPLDLSNLRRNHAHPLQESAGLPRIRPTISGTRPRRCGS